MRTSKSCAVVALALYAGIAGCATTQNEDENSPYFLVPKGSRIVLNQEIEILAHSARAYIQSGRVMPLPDINRYHPHCKFELKQLLDTPQLIKPDTFVVTKSIEGIERGTRSGAIVPAASRLSGGLNFELYATYLYLESPTQKGVRNLTCQHLEDPVRARHVTISQIRKTLGNVATLHLATGKGH